MKLKLPDARNSHTGEIVAAKDAARATFWECPDCHLSVFLRKGKKRRAHFAHNGACNPSMALHNLCEQLIITNPKGHLRLQSGELFPYIKAIPRVKVRNREVDLMLIGPDGRRHAIEIFVTHALTEDKIGDLQLANCPTTEIAMSHCSIKMTKEDLLHQLIDETANKKDYLMPAPFSAPATQAEKFAPSAPRIDWNRVIQILGIVVLIAAITAVLYFLLKGSKSRKRRTTYRKYPPIAFTR